MIAAIRRGLLAALALTFTTPASALTSYVENFDGLDIGSQTALSDGGWLFFVNVFDDVGNFKFNYGPFGAPNSAWNGFDPAQASAVGFDGPNGFINVFSDYTCCDLGSGSDQGHGNGTDVVDTLVFQEQIVNAGDVGKTWAFSFDAIGGDIAGGSTSSAFIKTLDPNAGFSESFFTSVDTTALLGSGILTIDITAALDGHILQFGFQNAASNFEASGKWYDNANFQVVPVPGALVLLASGLLGLAGLRRK